MQKHKQNCEFESRSWRDILDTTLCDEVNVKNEWTNILLRIQDLH
jgi:hypothetical protein